MVTERYNDDFKYIYNEFGERLEIVGDITLNIEFWDCECYDNYIHSINHKYCLRCCSFEKYQPNSRENEVRKHFKRTSRI